MARWDFWWRTAAPAEWKEVAGRSYTTKWKPRGVPIYSAVSRGDLQRVKDLLDADPSLVESTDDQGGTGLTPLHMAASINQVDAASLLLARGADINARDTKGRTPQADAILTGREDIVEFLRQRGTTAVAAAQREQARPHSARTARPAAMLSGVCARSHSPT